MENEIEYNIFAEIDVCELAAQFSTYGACDEFFPRMKDIKHFNVPLSSHFFILRENILHRFAFMNVFEKKHIDYIMESTLVMKMETQLCGKCYKMTNGIN